MILKYLSTGVGQLASVLQKALPNHVVSLVHHFPAVAGDITRTCLLFLRRAAFLCKCDRTGDE
jgi:hypothetical protein